MLEYTVLDELIHERITALFITPLKEYSNPLKGIYSIFKGIGNSANNKSLTLGCSLNNLAQEMSPIDEGFRKQIEKIFQSWQLAIEDALDIFFRCSKELKRYLDQLKAE